MLLLGQRSIYLLEILWVSFDSKMTFENEKHLRSVSRAASERFGILKTWRVFRDRLLLGRCFRRFVLPALKCCSILWSSATDVHIKLLDFISQWCPFFHWGCVWVWYFSSRSVAVLYMLYKIRCNPMHYMVLYLCCMCQCGLHAVLGRTSVYLCASSLQNLAVP